MLALSFFGMFVVETAKNGDGKKSFQNVVFPFFQLLKFEIFLFVDWERLSFQTQLNKPQQGQAQAVAPAPSPATRPAYYASHTPAVARTTEKQALANPPSAPLARRPPVLPEHLQDPPPPPSSPPPSPQTPKPTSPLEMLKPIPVEGQDSQTIQWAQERICWFCFFCHIFKTILCFLESEVQAGDPQGCA